MEINFDLFLYISLSVLRVWEGTAMTKLFFEKVWGWPKSIKNYSKASALKGNSESSDEMKNKN